MGMAEIETFIASFPTRNNLQSSPRDLSHPTSHNQSIESKHKLLGTVARLPFVRIGRLHQGAVQSSRTVDSGEVPQESACPLKKPSQLMT